MNYNTVKQNKFSDKLLSYLRRHRRQHDPWLALNMTIFNSESGWSRIFNPIKHHEYAHYS